jgi:hypothetical protein
MKTFVQLLALCCCVTAHAAQQLVVPGGLSNVEGNSSGSGPFLTAGATFQQVYSASEFAALGAPTVHLEVVGDFAELACHWGGRFE